MTALTEVLLKEGYASSNELVRDWTLLIALSKLEQYQAEREFFEKKYNAPFEQVEQQVHQTRNQEDFAQEAELEDWEFAISALKWWQGKVEELHRAPNA